MGLTVDRLSVKLQKEEVLHQVSLDIRDGEFISLLGASGCGKTTLLKSIAGLLEIESGEIRMGGRDISRVAPERRGTVIVFQDLRLFPHMTVEKNIAFAMEVKKIPKAERKETVRRLLNEVQLPGYENRRIKEMSGGQMQRVALARALAANPRILLLDEPFSGLDERLRLEMGALVKKLHNERKLTTILVTHDKRETLQMSDRIVLMDQGHILQYASPEDIFYHPASRKVADYFGKANYISGRVEEHCFSCEFFEMAAEKEDGEYEVMLRPFDILPEPEGSGCLVEEIVFMGETVQLMLKTQKGRIFCQMVSTEFRRMHICEGDEIGIRINEAEAAGRQNLFKKETANEAYCI